MDITRVQIKPQSNVYLVHNRDSRYTQQVELWGKQGAIDARVRGIQRCQDRKNFVQGCQEKARQKKAEQGSKAIKAIVLYLRTNPQKARNKTVLLSQLKTFADSKGLQVSVKKFSEFYPLIQGLVY